MPRVALSLAVLAGLGSLAGLGFLRSPEPGAAPPAAAPSPRPSPPRHEPRRETIVFTAMRPTNLDLWLHEKPGAPARRLTDDLALDSNAVFSPDGRWIVFSSDRRGNADLWALDLSRPGAAPRPLTGAPALDDAPAFSPDGRRLAFVSTRDGDADIWVMPFDPEGDGEGRAVNLTRSSGLTNSPGGDFNPAFSPDGRRIVFASDRDGYRQSEIHVMEADGASPRRLTRSPGWDGSPAWSADGAAILFYSDREGGTSIWRMGADGSSPRKVRGGGALSPARAPGGRLGFADRSGEGWKIVTTDATGGAERLESEEGRDCRAPDFDARGRMICHGPGPLEHVPPSRGKRGPFGVAGGRMTVPLPDREVELLPVREDFPVFDFSGRKLASTLGFDRLMISDPDGGNSREISPLGRGRAWTASWSPDGQWLLTAVGPTFAGPGADVDVWKLRTDGSEAVNLTGDSDGNDAFPVFCGDGRRLVFRSGRDGNSEIYLLDLDGGKPVRLTDHPATDTMPHISPRCDQVAFTSDRGGNFDLHVLPVGPRGATGPPRVVAPAPGLDMHPKFSPDGRWLVFASERGGINDEEPLIPVYNPQPYGEIWAVRLRDGQTVRLTHNQYEDGTPAWGRVPE